ncbi:MAG: response regulator transcription factor [Peptoniphilus sp.]|uniref:response regulator transcription factor n=1 Tax=Peptoniphilus sp. TaxID=1971214 RepID=UPI002A74C961|nr:response regulator transcription factor [Peptoniphilus sp.]MDY2986834.1 response regulator transcription factor [Peptoniphilus sp.]
MINILIADDKSLIRDGISMILSLYENINVVGEVNNGKEVIDFVSKVNVDLILMDIRMPVMDGVEATKIIKERYPDIKVLILTTFNEDKYIFEGLKNGADGYLLKDINSDKLVKSIEMVYSGNVLMQPEVAKKMVDFIDRDSLEENFKKNKNFSILTNREYEIAILVSEGKSNKEISEILFITEGTVKNHITKILDKLEIRDRTQLAILIK